MSIRWLCLATLVTGCATSGDPYDADSEYAHAMTATEAARVLDLVNYPGVDAAALDEVVGLDARAARNIHDDRAGVDGKFPSHDDDVFLNVLELDAVPYVGDAAFQKLSAYAQAHPAPVGEHHDGVSFTGWQAEIVVWGVNSVPIGVLNGLLDDRAADNLVAARPFASLAEVAAVPLVARSALGALRGQGPVWWRAREHQGSTSLAGTFDGVTFDDATASKALEIANEHTREAMVAGGVYGNGASAIVGNRPYASLAGVASVSGVGASTMSGLHAYAASLLAAPRGTTPDGEECAATQECAVGLRCNGLTVSDTGWCRPEWMAGTFESTADLTIPDGNPAGATSSIVVSGLASVPEDIIVHLDIDHPTESELYVVLTQPSSAESVVWALSSSDRPAATIPAGAELDSDVNGTWTLRVVDTRGGNAGVLRGWSLELTSRYD